MGGVRGETIIVVKIESAASVQILVEFLSVSLHVNVLAKGMNPFVTLSAMGK